MLVDRKIKYDPKDKIPLLIKIIILGLVFSADSTFYIFYRIFKETPSHRVWTITFFSVMACAFIAYYYMRSPFHARKKKLLYSILTIFWAWILASILLLFLGYSSHWL
jgi:hypothetical protein